VAAMSACARGTVETPGKQVRAKAGLNRSILDQGWASFRQMLAYKLQAHRGQLVPVNPAYTSQQRSSGGHEAADNRKMQENFCCVACGHTMHADLNAASNILAAGHAVWASMEPAACGEVVRLAKPVKAKRAASVKQEPTEEIFTGSPQGSSVGILVI